MNYDQKIETVACVGIGVVGSGWVAHFLRQGFDVVAYDPRPEAETFMRRTVEEAWPTLKALGLQEGASLSRLHFTTDLADAVAGADFVQESVFEDLQVKQSVLSEIDRLCPNNVIVASSSAGFLARELQDGCVNPERVIVGHPFNPPYLIPLVEIVGGEAGAPEAIEFARAFYTATGCEAVVLRNEAIGYIGNRFQAAVYREAMHLIAENVASVEDIDRAMVHGPGLRWAMMGPLQIYYLGVQKPEQHPAFLKEITREIREGYIAPEGAELVPGTIDKIHRGIQHATRDFDHSSLKTMRDERIVALRKLVGSFPPPM